MEVSSEFTQVLNTWVIKHDLDSANQLKSMVYFHLKGMVKKQIDDQARHTSQLGLNNLPNTTSLLHDILIKLSAPDEVFDNRRQFFLSLALFVRWMLQDEIKKRSAKKRNPQQSTPVLLTESIDSSVYLNFDNVISNLEQLSQRCYEVALLHFFLGLDIVDIQDKLGLGKSTVYNEIASAKAYLRVNCAIH